MLKPLKFILIMFCLASLFSCAARVTLELPSIKKQPAKYVKTEFIKYSIQVGAFHSFSNAEAFSIKLTQYVDAFCFKDKDGFFKVRFGNYSSKESAHRRAQQLKDINVIEEYFLVLPEKYIEKNYKAGTIRQRIVKEADSYIGVPYRWGGEDSENGFDCSGLTFSVYRESGIMLPRTSRDQFKKGMFVLKKDLKKGDLVFFKIRGNTISHVGIYTGNSKFIHAPSKGKTVCYESLNSSYYKKHYGGARTYL